ncbi:MAG: SPFH domain-containing protein [Planctomycetes bacterium]|nr:SPFH domain-containing protein [Planctomycetota bacterium]MCW8137048.1 SPFH domain-containing protein [Planctomycetota bacterium]
MSIFLEIIEYQETRNDEISHRIPERGSAEFKLGGQCIVRENQVAVFCCGGKAADIFPPGRHTITTLNIPVITKLLSLPWGFKSPIRTEVYFVNTKIFTDLKWGTKEPITLRDTDFGLVRVRGFGRFAIRVTEPLVFINNLVGQDDSFRTDEIEDYLRDLIVSHVNDWLGTNMKSILDLPGQYKVFAEAMKPHLNASMAKYGLELTEFFINNFNLPEEVQKAVDKRASMGAIGDVNKYAAFQMADAMRDMAKNPGTGNSAGMMMGMMMPGMMMNQLNQQQAAVLQQQGKKPEQYASCPKCQGMNEKGARFCSHCGEAMVVEKRCPSCGAAVHAEAKFCNECGFKMGTKPKCPECQHENLPDAKFCVNCGGKMAAKS